MSSFTDYLLDQERVPVVKGLRLDVKQKQRWTHANVAWVVVTNVSYPEGQFVEPHRK